MAGSCTLILSGNDYRTKYRGAIWSPAFGKTLLGYIRLGWSDEIQLLYIL